MMSFKPPRIKYRTPRVPKIKPPKVNYSAIHLDRMMRMTGTRTMNRMQRYPRYKMPRTGIMSSNASDIAVVVGVTIFCIVVALLFIWFALTLL